MVNYVKIVDRFGKTIGASSFEAVANMFELTNEELETMICTHELIEKSNVFRSETIRFEVGTYQEVQLWQARLVAAWRCSQGLPRMYNNDTYTSKIIKVC